MVLAQSVIYGASFESKGVEDLLESSLGDRVLGNGERIFALLYSFKELSDREVLALRTNTELEESEEVLGHLHSVDLGQLTKQQVPIMLHECPNRQLTSRHKSILHNLEESNH